VSLEGVEATGPELAIGSEPGIDLYEGLGAQSVPAPLGVVADLDQAGVAEHAQVLGDPGLAQRKPLDQLAYGTLPLAEEVEDLPPPGLGHKLERRRHLGHYITRQLYNCQGIYPKVNA
jgi:hypothetical protein